MALIALPAPLALDLFLELVAFGFLLNKARTIAEFCPPLASPGGTDTILALDLALVLTRLGFGLNFARTTPEVLPDLTAPPALSISGTHTVIGECSRVEYQRRSDQGKTHRNRSHGVSLMKVE